MEMINVCTIIGAVLGVYMFVRKLNEIWYLVKLGRKAYKSLPPGDMGWPLLGSSFSFYNAFTVGGDPDSFIYHLLSRNGRVGMYKSHLYGRPTIIVTDPEICRRIYLDDEIFKPNYPKSVKILEVNGFFTRADHKSAYRIMAAPMNGYEVLSHYVDFIDQVMAKGLEEWSSMKEPIELLGEIGSLFFKVISRIFLGTDIGASRMAELETLYKDLGPAILSILPYDVPGLVYHRALKARKKIENVLECVIEEKRRALEQKETREVHSQMDKLIMARDENGMKLYDNNTIIDLLLGLLHAGHHTPAYAAMWALVHISEKPHIFHKAKEEQESILKQRPSTQKGLTFQEIKQMKYLMKFINELLRRNTIVVASFRKAKTDININDYIIPKGWSVLIWTRAVHMDPQLYSNPEEFDPSRWENHSPKPGTFIPFGIGTRFCPGSELTKLEITILLHHFILNYKMERTNPKCCISHLPAPKLVDNCLCTITKLP
ncbi:beta-amyrin 11-oxidase-like [Cucurbita moschata]|uniref:Beta-amyrin 11-oxidase-like n=1 Tax=Cucurbita moschata TaxID=3662 RepID=A0A6J1GJM1_CUCMO|nr:beta-amyrin 11-oxidase-like [Cucurbita moschata]